MRLPTRPPAPHFDATAAQVRSQAASIGDQIKQTTNTIVGQVAVETASFENAIDPIGQAENIYLSELWRLQLLQNAHPDPEICDAASDSLDSLRQARGSLYQHEELFNLVQGAQKNLTLEDLDCEQQRLLRAIQDSFVDKGRNLSADARAQLNQLNEEMEDSRRKFVNNLRTPPVIAQKLDTELDGLPKAMIEGFQLGEDGRRQIPLTRPNSSAILKECSNADTRKDVYLKSQSDFADNVPVFKDLVLRRDDIARLLGYSSFSAQSHRESLIKNPVAATKFLEKLRDVSQPRLKQNLQALADIQGSTPDELRIWDLQYLANQRLKTLNVDERLLSEYFPAEHVISRMMEVFQSLFGLFIDEVTDRLDAEVWHPDVRMFAVWEEDRSTFAGYLYTDIYPRKGKYNSAANFTVRTSHVDSSGNRPIPATSLICNLSPPTKERPSLLQHLEVIIAFHELGHGIHDLLGKSRYGMFHGNRTVKDFREVPSRLLEYWCWIPEILGDLSCHYSFLSDQDYAMWQKSEGAAAERPPKRMPETLARDLAATHNLNQGIAVGRAIAQGLFDLAVHNPPSNDSLKEMDLARVYSELTLDSIHVRGTDDLSDMGHGYATTTHFAWGMEGAYHQDQLNIQQAEEIWNTCFKGDPMSATAGRRYRRILLEKGGTRDELQMMHELLGRPSDVLASD